MAATARFPSLILLLMSVTQSALLMVTAPKYVNEFTCFSTPFIMILYDLLFIAITFVLSTLIIGPVTARHI